MVIRKYEEDTWYLDFISKKVFFELDDRILINIGEKDDSEWVALKVYGVGCNPDGYWLEGDDGTDEEHVIRYPCQIIIDARN